MKSYYSLVLIVFIACLFIFTGCENENISNENLLFPAGRSFLGSSEITVTTNDAVCSPEFIYDSCGGYWIKIHKEDLPKNGIICIQYIRKKEDLILFQEPAASENDWLSESFYIDCNHDLVKAKAAQLTQYPNGNIEKAKQIQQFVIGHIAFQNYKDSFLEKASTTYTLGYGTCMNFSRLYIALCRAAGIPARSVWGIVYGYNNDNIYDYHHQWAEIRDENGYWHPADFNYTRSFDLNDIRYLDLLYAAEENSFLYENSSGTIIPGNVKYFNNYPATLTGRLGFEMTEDHRPEYMTVQYTYTF
ncbi:MAG: transglutaminase domain-containing protein [Bacteroidales bacterium]|nr:transglutaminase domain-containing protein [Bacteroidales bacterium]